MKKIAVDVNPATRSVMTGTEVYTREVCLRLPAAAPEFDFRFYAARARAGLGVDVMVLPFRRLWSQVRLPFALTRARERAYLRLTTRWAVQRCPLLITVSESTKADLVSYYHVREDRIRVVPLGATPAVQSPAPPSRLAELGLNGNFVLQVGRIEARKNQAAALAAVEQLDGVTLVVAGPERDAALAARLRESPHCKVVGRVDQATLELLYEQAQAVVVPSLYEGFGLPLLEAMARGKVVVAAKSSSLPEVGGDAALYVHNASDPAQLAKVLEVALGDKRLRTSLGRAALARARKFTWEKTAAGVAGVIRELF